MVGGAIIIASVVTHMLMTAKEKRWKARGVEMTPHE